MNSKDMFPHRDVKFPPLTESQRQKPTDDHSLHKYSVQTTEEGHEKNISVQTCSPRKLRWTGSSYMYTGSRRKPELLMQLESYVEKELHNISPHEPKFQELKLQVYRNVFSCFMSAFRTYQPLLSTIKKEYENTLVLQQDQIRELEPLRSHLRLMTEECDQKLQTQRKEVQAEVDTLIREKQQLQKHIEALKEKEKDMQTVAAAETSLDRVCLQWRRALFQMVQRRPGGKDPSHVFMSLKVDHLQSELASQYLQYRKECDARKLLIWQLNDLLKDSVRRERPADESSEYSQDSVALQLALKVCREDLTKTQVQLNKLKAEYWDVVPRHNWDDLEQNHKQTLLQLKKLRDDFDLMKSEYDTLLEIHKKGSIETKTHVSTSVQTEEGVPERQDQIQVNSGANESTTLTIQGFRNLYDPEMEKSDTEADEHVTEAEIAADCSCDDVLFQIPP